MYRILCFTSCLLLFAACGERQPAEPDVLPEDSANPPGSNEYCFSYAKEKNTVSLNYVAEGDSITGELFFDYYEKDANTGTVSGIRRGDTLFLNYLFDSEGVTSEREVVFLVTDSTAREGYGMMRQEGERMVFDNPQDLRFSDSFTLQAIPCD